MEEEAPVDVLAQLGERRRDLARAGEGWGGESSACQSIGVRLSRARSSGSSGLRCFSSWKRTEPLLVGAVAGVERLAAIVVEQPVDDVDDA